MCKFGENFVEHWTLVFTISILVEVELNEIFHSQWKSSHRVFLEFCDIGNNIPANIVSRTVSDIMLTSL